MLPVGFINESSFYTLHVRLRVVIQQWRYVILERILLIYVWPDGNIRRVRHLRGGQVLWEFRSKSVRAAGSFSLCVSKKIEFVSFVILTLYSCEAIAFLL
jgi:hypothetical protein